MEDSLNQIGTVKLDRQQTIQSVVEGRVEQVFVEEGDRVTAGQALLLLQDDTWETRRLEHELTVQQKEIDLVMNQQAIATTETDLQDAQATLRASEALYDKGYVSRDEVDQTRRTVRTTEATLQNQLLQLEQTHLELQSLRLQAQTIEQEKRNNQVLSPGRALILDVIVQRGSVVEIGTNLMVLGDPNRELVHLQLPPLRAQQVKPLQPARIRPLGPESAVYSGTVQYVALFAGSSQDNEQAGEPTNLNVIVELDRPSQTLIPGTQVSVDIIPEQRMDVVKVEAGAVQQSDEGFFVWVLGANNTAQRRPITIGLEGLTELEVTQGLEDGDQVIVRPDRPLNEGMTVQVMDDPLLSLP
ncbi:MAG: efflux RND transporter periplasmic adaptor subunit [Cyanothece sp. SIO2G6]|nr:efflux RND transporter periplasmic adaptor subunit [Cyanothece sp. SIO2G6]